MDRGARPRAPQPEPRNLTEAKGRRHCQSVTASTQDRQQLPDGASRASGHSCQLAVPSWELTTELPKHDRATFQKHEALVRPAWGSETHARVFAESTKIPNLKAYKNFRPAEGQFRFLIGKWTKTAEETQA